MMYRLKTFNYCIGTLHQLQSILNRDVVIGTDIVVFLNQINEEVLEGIQKIELEEVEIHNLKMRKEFHTVNVEIYKALMGPPSFKERTAEVLIKNCLQITKVVHTFLQKWDGDTTKRIKYSDSLLHLMTKQRKTDNDKQRLAHIKEQLTT